MASGVWPKHIYFIDMFEIGPADDHHFFTGKRCCVHFLSYTLITAYFIRTDSFDVKSVLFLSVVPIVGTLYTALET